MDLEGASRTMITQLHCKNFKVWRDTGAIRLAPLTVLFGSNSAGKTSIPQLLLLLKQTAESPDRHRALQFGDSRSLVDLGSYDEAIHNHDVSQQLEIALTWTLDDALQVRDPLTEAPYDGGAIEFAVAFSAGKQHQPLVESFTYRLLNRAEAALTVGMDRQENGDRYKLSAESYKPVRQPGRPWPLSQPGRFYGFPNEATAYYQNMDFLSDLELRLEYLLRSVYYVGPLREHPKRLYFWSGEVPDHVGVRGDRAIEAILAAGDRRFNFGPKQWTSSLGELVAARLRAMGLIHGFEVRSLGEHRKEYEVWVQTGRRLPMVKLTDVGFGISQVLPVIVECFYVPRRSIVIFEQPEIHLHPSVQAELADLFVDAIRARERGVARECQFIVESHSEHFLRRLQRRIAEEAIDRDAAALYFVDTERDGAVIHELDVDAYGNILNWPEGFFGDEMGDMVARSEAQARRMQQAPNGG